MILYLTLSQGLHITSTYDPISISSESSGCSSDGLDETPDHIAPDDEDTEVDDVKAIQPLRKRARCTLYLLDIVGNGTN